jgi:ABC-type nitrate/sulfonate/bicarbonate transport system substrate-binding protein
LINRQLPLHSNKESHTFSWFAKVFWGVPIWIAIQEGFFEELELDVTLKTYPSGGPQVSDAVENKAWDVGAAGCVPNIIGATQGIQVIGISNDESATNALLGNAAGADAWPPESMQGVPVAVTPNSTGAYAALKCLRNEFPNITDEAFIYEQQADVIASITPNANGEAVADYGALWAPNMYNILDFVVGSRVVCSGESSGAVVPGGIMVRAEFAEERPDLTTKILAAWLRGIGFMKNPALREEAVRYVFEYYVESNVVLSDNAVRQEFALRPLFGLDQQLKIMERKDGEVSEVDGWYNELAQFLDSSGVIQGIPEESTYITSVYLNMVKEDAFLRNFSHLSDFVEETDDENGQGGNDSAAWKPRLIGLVLVNLLVALIL